jgi:ribosomal protein S18 acetylase RimI-like enzyme
VTGIVIRSATRRDAADIVALFDMAARGLANHLWTREAGPGQSALEVGRAMVLGETPGISYQRCWMAEADGEVGGLLAGYRYGEIVDPASRPAELRPIVELENAALGYWLVNLLASYPQFRGRGVGAALLAHAEKQGRATGSPGMALVVDSLNDGARRLYARSGYRTGQTRPVVPFPGHPPGGEFELMLKPFA